MAEQCREARYGGCTAGQPALFKSITTSSSSASTTRAEGSSNSAETTLTEADKTDIQGQCKQASCKAALKTVITPLHINIFVGKTLNASVLTGPMEYESEDTHRFTANSCFFTSLLGL